MVTRFRRIREEFGTFTLVRVLIGGVGMIAMAALSVILFRDVLASVIAGAGTLLGYAFRVQLPNYIEYLSKAISVALFAMGVALFIGERLEIATLAKFIIIALTTTLVFNLQFWTLSDPKIINLEK